MPFNIGAPELIIILVIALLVIGPGKLPDVGQALGKSIREFRKAASDVEDAVKVDTTPAPPPAAPSQPAAAPAPNQLSQAAAPNESAQPAAQPAAPAASETPTGAPGQ